MDEQARRRPVVSQTLAVLAVWWAVSTGCAHTAKRPDLGRIYDQAAQAPDYLRNPVIVIPGVLGSRLVDEASGRVVWGVIDRSAADPRKPDGARLVALPMAEGVPLSQLRDAVHSAGALDRLNIRYFGVPIQVSGYAQILAALGVAGYRDKALAASGDVDYGDEHFTCFQFDYDWRRDISETAAQLHRFILQRRDYVRRELFRRYGIADADVKFDIVAHSMGGLVARYYLRYGPQPLPDDGTLPRLTWEGGRFVERAILVATPNAGSAETIFELVRGTKIGPFLPTYPPAIVGTMPATYQLLPRWRHGALVDANNPQQKLDALDPQLWERLGWGLASPDQDEVLKMLLPQVSDRKARRRIALDHQRKCLLRARQFQAALDVPAEPPDDLSLHLFAGDTLDTNAVMAADLATGAVKVVQSAPGDGIVTRASAVMDERMGSSQLSRFFSPVVLQSKTFLPTDHLGLTRDPTFTDNVLSLLLESPPRRY